MVRLYVFATLVATALASIQGISAADSICTKVEENTDYVGHDYGYTERKTAEECCADCRDNIACKVFVWYEGKCYLKSTVGEKISSSGRTAGFVPRETYVPITQPPTAVPVTGVPGTSVPITQTPTAVPVVPTTQTPTLERNTDYLGHDYAITKRSTPEECCDDCRDNISCKVFVWYDGTCYLKSTVGEKIHSNGRTAGFVSSQSTPPPMPPTTHSPEPSTCSKLEENVDYVGGDYGVTERTSAKDCCDDCARDHIACKLFVWFEGKCYLKSSMGEKISSPDRTAGFVSSPVTTVPPTSMPTLPPVTTLAPKPTTCANVQEDTDYEGHDFAYTKRASPEECCADCQSGIACKVVVWYDGTCYLKSSIGKKISAPGRKAYFSRDQPSTCSALEENVDYTGQDIGSVDRGSADLCCADCQANPACKLFVWYQNVCYLKSSAGQKVSSRGRIAGYASMGRN
ncbi:hypothetical protein AC1031_010162 [Aphanomyces cochlioides]|nr:hypothetical protein AC1031_010162 [Aphanomyces cochlioides]